MTAPVYIEHTNPHYPSKVRRYATLDEACVAVAAATWCSLEEVQGVLGDGAAAAFRYGYGVWTVVQPSDFGARYGWYSDVEARMDDVDTLGDL